MNAKSLLIGFITGGAVAGIATLLTAPTSGKESRKYIKDNTDSLKEQMAELKMNMKEVTDSISSLTKEGKESIGTLAKDIKILIDSWKSEITPHQEQLKKEFQALQETFENLEESIATETKNQ